MVKNSPYKILIVDDNRNNLYTLRNLLQQYIDATVIEADCGQKALQELIRNTVDLIILDVQMEGMDGFELATLVKARKKTKDIPIVFLSASYTNDDFKNRGFGVGAVDYLTKPIDEYQLINRINVYLKLIEKERRMNVLLEEKVYEQTQELRWAKEQAEAANEAKNTFLANISHELRTPLNIIMSTNQLISYYLNNDEELDRNQISRKIAVQVQNCNRLLRLVNNLIDITKIDSGHFEIAMQSCNIVNICESITLSVAEYVENKGIKLIFDTESEEVNVECDINAIERIMLNLLSNAIKFTPVGGTIFVSLEDKANIVIIKIRDTGIGIPQEKQQIIFERFKQADELLTRRHEGSGIGLNLVKSLVDMHGGRIYLSSKENEGSEFLVQLPKGSGDIASTEVALQYTSCENVIQKVQVEFSDIYFMDTAI